MTSSDSSSSARRTARARPEAGLGGPAELVARSLLPLAALVLIAGTALWGPWVTLVLTVLWWRSVCRLA